MRPLLVGVPDRLSLLRGSLGGYSVLVGRGPVFGGSWFRRSVFGSFLCFRFCLCFFNASCLSIRLLLVLWVCFRVHLPGVRRVSGRFAVSFLCLGF